MHVHERIDPRRGPGRECDDGRREIADGVTEYEEARDAHQADDYDSREDWDFTDCNDDWSEEDEESMMTDVRDEAYQAHEPDDIDAHISARVENNRIVIEVPILADTSPDRWAKIVEDLKRRITIDLTDDGKATRH